MAEDRHPGTPGGGSGADVKSGQVTLTEGDSVSVVFATAFASTPEITLSMTTNGSNLSHAYSATISTTGFDIWLLKVGGGGDVSRVVHWIATDAGDP